MAEPAPSFSEIFKPLKEWGNDVKEKLILPFFNNVLGIKSDKIETLKTRIQSLLTSIKDSSLGKVFDSIVLMFKKAFDLIVSLLTTIFNWIAPKITNLIGGGTLGFWVFWAVAGTLLLIAVNKLIKKFRQRNDMSVDSFNTELLKNQALLIEEKQEAGFITKRVLNSGVEAVQETINTGKQLDKEEGKEQAKTTLRNIGIWMLTVTSGALSMLLMAGFFISPSARFIGLAFQSGVIYLKSKIVSGESQQNQQVQQTNDQQSINSNTLDQNPT